MSGPAFRPDADGLRAALQKPLGSGDGGAAGAADGAVATARIAAL